MAEYKRFIAPTLEEARRDMIRVLGVNAYILETRKVVKKRFMGFKKDTFIEIKAGKLNNIPSFTKKSQSGIEREKAAEKKPGGLSFAQEAVSGRSSLENQDRLDQVRDLIAKRFNSEKGQQQKENSGLQREPAHTDAFTSSGKTGDSTEVRYSSQQNKGLDLEIVSESAGERTGLRGFLEEYEFEGDLLRSILEKTSLNARDFGKSPMEKERLAKEIAGLFRYSGDLKIYASNPNLILLVGPTGVGKTHDSR